jgi:4-hydroxy-L-threonine phosphate dehydrogenase PdxA
MNDSLKKDFWIEKPKIAVLGLNPHAGDHGIIGTEDDQIIRPTVEKANEQGSSALVHILLMDSSQKVLMRNSMRYLRCTMTRG